MGCGSSRVENSRFRQTYGEPSEFDTCSSVVSAVRDPRGEPDGMEIFSSPVPKEVLNDYNNRVSNITPKEERLAGSRGKPAPRSAVSKTRSNLASTDSDFNELKEPAVNDDGLLDGAGKPPRPSQLAPTVGDFLTAS